jgi:hypothetical protein
MSSDTLVVPPEVAIDVARGRTTARSLSQTTALRRFMASRYPIADGALGRRREANFIRFRILSQYPRLVPSVHPTDRPGEVYDRFDPYGGKPLTFRRPQV